MSTSRAWSGQVLGKLCHNIKTAACLQPTSLIGADEAENSCRQNVARDMIALPWCPPIADSLHEKILKMSLRPFKSLKRMNTPGSLTHPAPWVD